LTEDFGLFIEDRGGPFWKGLFFTLEEAKREIQGIAVLERCASFVFNFADECEVKRFFSSQRGSA
jgi:hypothetical protein